jgi:primosomal protein N' (replication factor Y)
MNEVESSPGAILKVAVDCPLRTLLDYLPPAGVSSEDLPAGSRVRVSLGRASAVGVIVAHAEHSPLPRERLRAIVELLDAVPLFEPELLDLLQWTASYYHHPPGEVFASALPAALRAGQPARGQETWVNLNAEGRAAAASGDLPRRAPRQRELLSLLSGRTSGWPAAELDSARAGWRTAARALQERGWVEFVERQAASHDLPAIAPRSVLPPEATPELSAAQIAAISTIDEAGDAYGT